MMLTDTTPLYPEELSMTAPPLASTAPALTLPVESSPRVSLSPIFLFSCHVFLSSHFFLFPSPIIQQKQSIVPLVASCFLSVMRTVRSDITTLPSRKDLSAVTHLTTSSAEKFAWLAAGGLSPPKKVVGDAFFGISSPGKSDSASSQEEEEEQEEI